MDSEEAKKELEMIHGQVVEEMKVDLSGELNAEPSPADAAANQLRSWLSTSSSGLMDQSKAAAAKDWIAGQRKGLKPWREFFKSDKFHVPSNPALVARRVAANVNEFQSNYLCVFGILALYCLLTSPMLLLALAACGVLLYLARIKAQDDGTLRLGGRSVSKAGQYGLVAAVSFPLFWLAGAGSAIFWVIGASIFLILVHAAVYASEPRPGAEFLVEDV